MAFSWSVTARPEGSSAALTDPDTARPSITLDEPGSFTLQLVVSDGVSSSAPDSVTLSTENSAPVADAGSDLTGRVDERVDLDGRGSSDADGDALSFAWVFLSQPAGASDTLNAADTPQPWFVPGEAALYVVQLIVNDGFANSTPDTTTVTVEVRPNAPPVAVANSASTPQDTAVNIPVLADDSDADGDALSITAVTQPAHGAAIVDGTQVRDTPAAEYLGPDSFSYRISDGLNSDIAQVGLTVVNYDPDAVPEFAGTFQVTQLVPPPGWAGLPADWPDRDSIPGCRAASRWISLAPFTGALAHLFSKLEARMCESKAALRQEITEKVKL